MSSDVLLCFVLAYFCLLLLVAYFTSKKSNNESFFIGNRNSNWMLVAFGMIGTSLSGVTFVSVPGTVGSAGFQYFQVVIGYFLGYIIVAYVLLPLYYRLQLTSIYTYLQQRIGMVSYKTGALFFILSRTLGATARLYLVVNILQIFILDKMGIPFWVTAFVILLLILLYTFEGGVKTIVYTDTLQTTFMLLGLVVCIIALMSNMGTGIITSFTEMNTAGYTNVFNTDYKSSGFFLKQIIGGAFITVGMTGLDQEMMQKNISVKKLGDSQKNMMTFSTIIVFVNLLFLFLGGCLYLYAAKYNLSIKGDDLFPHIALSGVLPAAISILFIIGLISALFPSADGALTALTSSFCIDILGINRNEKSDEAGRKKTRLTVHITFAIIFFVCTMIFKMIDDRSIIDVILKLAGYTYGPLLGLFAFGILSKNNIKDAIVLPICIIAPLLTLLLDVLNNPEWFIKKLTLSEPIQITLKSVSESLFHGYKIGIELLIINGFLTWLFLMLFSKKNQIVPQANS